jgi:hypothetical protein
LVKPKASLSGKCFISLSADEVEKINTQKTSDNEEDETNSSEEMKKYSLEKQKFEGVAEVVEEVNLKSE